MPRNGKPVQKAEAGGWDYIYEKVSTQALCSLTNRILQIQIQVKNKATLDAHWVCYIHAHNIHYKDL